MWVVERGAESKAPPGAVWELWADPAREHEYDDSIEWARLDGPLQPGAVGQLKPRGARERPFAVLTVEPGRRIVTSAGPRFAKITFDRRLGKLADGGTRIYERITISGPLAALSGRIFGRPIADRLPNTLKRLADQAARDAGMSGPNGDRGRRDPEIRRHLLDDVTVKARTSDFPGRKNFVLAWYGRMERADQLSDRFKFWYYVVSALTSLAAASIPALIAAAGSSDAQAAKIMRFLAAGLGVLVALATAVLGVVQFGNRWRVYRTYSQALEEAGWNYVTGDEGDSGYSKFVSQVTTAHRAYGREYLAQVAMTQGTTATGTTSTPS